MTSKYICFVVEYAEYEPLTIPIQAYPNVAVYISASSAINERSPYKYAHKSPCTGMQDGSLIDLLID